MDNQIS